MGNSVIKMYRRFLNNNDYLALLTPKALSELTREDMSVLAKAEEAAEMSILEYLTANYEVEKELSVGKYILEYNRQVTYPSGVFFYKDGGICETLRTINGYKAPSDITYWEKCDDVIETKVDMYRQTKNYSPGDYALFANTLYICREYNGFDFNNIRLPGVSGWREIPAYKWEANLIYDLWKVVEWENKFYTLINSENIDLTVNPHVSDNWGLIGEYDPLINEYEFSETEYVVFNGKVYVPDMEVNSDVVTEGVNIRKSDPRNSNLKKHILRMAVYELHKLVSPSNVSNVRITDYEASIVWLRDASKLRINPQIPRKLDQDKTPVTDWQIATFQRDYDPYKNPWQV